jgi:hypothetical protein
MESKLRSLSSACYADSLRFQKDEPDGRRRIPPSPPGQTKLFKFYWEIKSHEALGSSCLPG